MNKVLVIHIKKDTVLEAPIDIHLNSDDSPIFLTVLIKAEKNSKARILFHTSGNCTYFSDDIRIKAEQGSNVNFVSIQNLPQATVVQKRTSIIGKDAEVAWDDCLVGGKYVKSNVQSLLEDEGANGKIKVLFASTQDQRHDIYTASLHHSKNTYSDILTKGVVTHTAKALSRGLVHIGRNASGSNGYEKQDVLLLSKNSEGDAIPNLEIHNHDVKCSHGSTVGQIDKEKMFYLLSRGLDEDAAKKIMVEGYFSPVLDLFDSTTKHKISNAILESIGGTC